MLYFCYCVSTAHYGTIVWRGRGEAMARLTIYPDNHVDSTVVSNLFIDEYMKDANDAQLKVYLYLLRKIGRAHV